jgi:predicted RND superfamily exporter protein
VALVVLWVFGAMALSGITFNPVTAMIASIAIGIGVPYTIHITHRYQEDRVRFDSPEEAIRNTMTHTGGALAGSAFTTVAGFGILVTSSLRPFQQFGQVVAYAIGFAMLGAVLVLPSLLVLWDRWHRRRGESAFDADVLEEALHT